MFPLKDNLPTTRPAVLTLALIAVNVLVYFLWQHGGITSSPGDAHTIDWGWIPYEVQHSGEQCEARGSQIACGPGIDGKASPFVTALTSMFMHGSILHLAGNMLFLWIFGNNIEDSLGPVRFLIFYVACGLGAIALQTVFSSGTDAAVPMVGASGAIAGVLGGYLLLYPRARVLTAIFIIIFFTLLEVPAIVMIGLWFVQQAVFAWAGLSETAGASGGVAYFAHVGGFLTGMLLIKLLRPAPNPAYARMTRAHAR